MKKLFYLLIACDSLSYFNIGQVKTVFYYFFHHISKKIEKRSTNSIEQTFDSACHAYNIYTNLFIGFIANWRRKKKCLKRDDSLTDKGNEIVFDIQNFTKQQQIIIHMFLNATDNRIKKETLKESLWPNHTDPTTNMTTAIRRLKDVLKKKGYGYTINTCSKDKSFYILKSNSCLKND